MANLKYKNSDNSWTSILLTRGATGPQGEPGQNGLDAEITLNGIKNRIAEFYAPTSAGQAGQFLMSNGEGQAPTFASVPAGTETINNLTTSTFVENQALSAYQGYILNQNKVDKSTTIAGTNLQDSITATELKTSLSIPTSLTIGNTKKNLATGDIGWSVSEIGAAPASHYHGTLSDNFTVSVDNTTTDSGWSMIQSGYNNDGFILKSVRLSASSPSWAVGNYGAGICFGGADTKGIISHAYGSPYVKFAGGNGSKPVWNMGITGTSGNNYNLDSIATKTTTFVQSSTPTANRTGDIWIIP